MKSIKPGLRLFTPLLFMRQWQWRGRATFVLLSSRNSYVFYIIPCNTYESAAKRWSSVHEHSCWYFSYPFVACCRVGMVQHRHLDFRPGGYLEGQIDNHGAYFTRVICVWCWQGGVNANSSLVAGCNGGRLCPRCCMLLRLLKRVFLLF